jgi:hypothetical protein
MSLLPVVGLGLQALGDACPVRAPLSCSLNRVGDSTDMADMSVALGKTRARQSHLLRETGRQDGKTTETPDLSPFEHPTTAGIVVLLQWIESELGLDESAIDQPPPPPPPPPPHPFAVRYVRTARPLLP